MIKEYNSNDLIWVDLSSPTSDEVREIMDKYDVDPLAAQELLLPTPKPKVEKYGDFIYMTIHFPAWQNIHKESVQEIDFIIGKKLIITAHYDDIAAIHKFSKIFEVNSLLSRKSKNEDSAGILFFDIMKNLYTSLENELDFIKDSLKNIEEKIFDSQEKDMVFELSKISRKLLLFKRATSLHKETLDHLEVFTGEMFGGEFIKYLNLIKTEYRKVYKTTDGFIESLSELRETNNSLLETKQNKIIHTLTVITFITSTIAIVGTLLQIDTVTKPIVGVPGDFWMIVGLFGLIAGIMLIVFKWKKWL